jgi:uncharacterized protein (DUF952 family)
LAAVTIFHLVIDAVWSAADASAGPYAPPSLASEGFVHGSTAAQLERVVAERFPDRDDLLVLEIDPSRLTGELRWEDSHGDGRLFPHVYGPIDREAIVAVRRHGTGRT